MSRPLPSFLSLLALSAAICAPVAAQTAQTGALEGRVTVADGRVVANAVVTIEQTGGAHPRAARSDEYGTFRIPFLPPGTYAVTVRLIGYRPVTHEGIPIRALEVTPLTVVLTPAPAELDTATVRADRIPVVARTTEFTSSIAARERELLPAPRDANALIAFTPGARPGQIFGGSTTQANLYQFDGVTVNQPGRGGSFLLPNVDWIEEFKVIGPGAGAEYGNFQGGLVNIVTKSGSNTRQGQLRTFYEHRALAAQDVNAFESGMTPDHRIEVNGEFRGPIVRDRIYFYLSGQEARSGSRVLDPARASGTGLAWLPTLATRREQKYYGKLTWQTSERDIVNVSLGVDNVFRERVGLTGYDAVDATYRGRSPSLFSQANLQRTLDSRRSFQLGVSGYRGADDELPYHGPRMPAVVLLDAPNAPRFVNALYTRRNTPASLGFTGVYDHHLHTERGQHHLRIGGEYVVGLWREQRTRNGGLTWYTEAGDDFDARNPATWREIPSLGVYATADTGGRIDLTADSRNAAFFVQDYLRVNDRLSISAGLRAGLWVGSIVPGNGGGSRGTPTFQALSATGFDPRIGATLDVSGNGSLVARAHWGRYHQNLFALFYDRAPGANVFTNIEYCDWNDTDRSVLPELGRAYSTADFNRLFTCFAGANLFNEARAIEGYRQPYMDQLTLGLTKTLGPRLEARAVYLTRRNRAVLSLVDRNLDANWAPIVNVRVSEAGGPVRDPDGRDIVLPVVYVRADDLRARLSAGDVIPGYVASDTVRLTYDPQLVLRPVDEAERAFDQVQLSLQGDWPGVSFNAALVFTNLTGNVFSVNGWLDPAGEGNGPFVDRNTMLDYAGRLPNASPWEVKLRASGRLPWGFEGGAFFTYMSGDFWTPSLEISRDVSFAAEQPGGTVPLDERLFRGAAGQVLFTEPRGSRQFGGRADLDLRLQRVFRVGGNDVIVGGEVFNLFNGSAVTSRKERVNDQDPADPASLAGAVRFRQPPTMVRLNVQYRL